MVYLGSHGVKVPTKMTCMSHLQLSKNITSFTRIMHFVLLKCINSSQIVDICKVVLKQQELTKISNESRNKDMKNTPQITKYSLIK